MIHHINCGLMRPYSALFVNGHGGAFSPALLSCRVLLIEGPDGLALVDSGFGLSEARHPELVRLRRMLRPEVREQDAAIRQIAAMGLDIADLRDIVLTHGDVDHAGGLPDFPAARIHIAESELRSIRADLRQSEPKRYHRHQFAHEIDWRVHDSRVERWKGLPASAPFTAAGLEMRLIDLPGHTRGHCGVAIRRAAGWLLHVGDATYCEGELAPLRRRAPIVLRWFTRFAALRADAAEETATRLREMLAANPDVRAICSHDPRWLEARWQEAA